MLGSESFLSSRFNPSSVTTTLGILITVRFPSGIMYKLSFLEGF